MSSHPSLRRDSTPPSDVAWRELIATRVLLAHAYHRVDLNLLWDIAIDDLSRLARALGPIVNGEDGYQDVD